ncbi:group II intron maturase-specific domain-containing protein [Streptomyces sp. P9-A2]|uniref:group II intron maturase-specific domain-containing protein n=1 Tax=Streptomyces sp. P9-A2 TaxID=3072284 RepID=UPI002FCAF169
MSPVRPQSAEVGNPTVRGWMQYFGRFYRSALTPLLTRINACLARWIRQKHKKLAALREALQKMWEIADRYPRMFAHWSWTTVASGAW